METRESRSTEALKLLERFRYLRTDQIQGFLFLGSDVTFESQRVGTGRTMRRLLEHELVGRTESLVGGFGGGSSGHIWMRREGRARPKPTIAMEHTVRVADVALAFYRAALHPEDAMLTFDPEYELGPLTADAHIAYRHDRIELQALLEYETGSQSSRKVQNKVSRYVNLYHGGDWQKQLEIWPTVLFVASSKHHRDQLKRATEVLETPDTTEFAFATFEDVLTDPMEPVWYVAGKQEPEALFEEEEAA